MALKSLISIGSLILSILYLIHLLTSGDISLAGIAVLGVLIIYLPIAIFVGQRQTEHPLGYVADLCPKCGEARTVEVRRAGLATSVFGIPLGEGELLGFSGKCGTCASEFEVQPMGYATFEKNPLPFPQIAHTNPKLDPGKRSAMEAYQRLALIRGKFLKSRQALMDRTPPGYEVGPLPFLAFVAACGFPIWLGFTFPDTPLWIDATVFGLGFLASLAFFVVHSRGEPLRYFNKELLPGLASSLVVLKPQPAELDSCIEGLNLYGYEIGKFFTTQSLLNELSTAVAAEEIDDERAPVRCSRCDSEIPPNALECQRRECKAMSTPLVVDIDGLGQCPNCESEIPMDSIECPNPKCQAVFGPGSAWQIKPL